RLDGHGHRRTVAAGFVELPREPGRADDEREDHDREHTEHRPPATAATTLLSPPFGPPSGGAVTTIGRVPLPEFPLDRLRRRLVAPRFGRAGLEWFGTLGAVALGRGHPAESEGCASTHDCRI